MKSEESQARAAGSSQDLVKNSSLYKEFLAEREEILRHKWIESEKAGHDIGFEHALLDWIMNHRARWRAARAARGGSQKPAPTAGPFARS